MSKISTRDYQNAPPWVDDRGESLLFKKEKAVMTEDQHLACMAEPEVDKGDKYKVVICDRNNVDVKITVDVYDVLIAYGINNPATAHAVKKILKAGTRGAKDFDTDINEGINSLVEAKKLEPLMK